MAMCRKQDDEYFHAAGWDRHKRGIVGDAEEDQPRPSQAVNPLPERVGHYK